MNQTITRLTWFVAGLAAYPLLFPLWFKGLPLGIQLELSLWYARYWRMWP